MRTTLRQYARHLLRKMPHAEAIGAACLLAALLAIFFWRAVFLGESLLPNDLIYELDPVWQGHAPPGFVAPGNRLLSDVVYFFYPWQAEMQRALSEHRAPLWTPHINNGQPMLGNGQVGVWDPFWVIARLFPLNTSFLVAAFLKLWVGGLATFLLARRLGIGRRGALLAMVTFAFSGPMLVWLGLISGVAAWLPLLLYSSERALARRTGLSFLLIALVIACQFFSMHPETSFHNVIVWGAFCLARMAARYGWNVRQLAGLLGKMALAFTIGVTLSGAVLLPTVEGILNSYVLVRRQAGASAALLPTILFEWRNWPTLVTTVLPQFFGTPIDNSYWYPYQNYNEQTLYAGIVPLALGLVALLAWWRERRHGTTSVVEPAASSSSGRGFWMGLTLVVMGVATQLPLFNVVSVVPLLRLANHGRLRLVYVLGLALLAGYGLDALTTNQSARFNAPKRFLTTLTVLAVASLLLVGGAWAGVTFLHDQFINMGRTQAEAMKALDHPMFPYSLDYYYERVNLRYDQTRRLYTLATPEMFLPVGVVLVAGLLEWYRRRTGKQAVWLNGLVLLSCADLFLIGMHINPTMPPAQVFPPTPTIQFLQQQPGLFRVGGLYLALMPNSSMVFGLSDVRGYEPVVPWRQATLFNQIEGAFRLNHYTVLRSAESRLLDLMNVEYMVADREPGGRWTLAFDQDQSPIRVYRNPDVLPRAFIVYQSEHAVSAQAALSRLLDKSFNFRTQVILEGAPLNLPVVSQVLPEAGQARIVQHEPERVVIETDALADGILVLTDTYTPGWQARVDAQPAEVYIADYAFRAVRVPAGQHRVEFVYAPVSFAVGSAVSIVALVCCGLWAAVILYQRMR